MVLIAAFSSSAVNGFLTIAIEIIPVGFRSLLLQNHGSISVPSVETCL
jgi:hypothetical protein